MPAGARLLRDARDGGLDVLRRDHHQVRELVDHDDDVRQLARLGGASAFSRVACAAAATLRDVVVARRRNHACRRPLVGRIGTAISASASRSTSCSARRRRPRRRGSCSPSRRLLRHGRLVVGDSILSLYLAMSRTPVGSELVAALHLLDGPAQREVRLLRIGDHRQQQVRDALVDRELEHLRVDHDHPDVLGRRVVEQRGDHRVDRDRLARAGGAGDEQVRHAREIDVTTARPRCPCRAPSAASLRPCERVGARISLRNTFSRGPGSAPRCRPRPCRGSARRCARAAPRAPSRGRR